MQEQYRVIGETAGKIYRALEQNGAKTITNLQREAEITDSALFHQALGWLARESKVNFEKQGKGLVISLSVAQVVR